MFVHQLPHKLGDFSDLVLNIMTNKSPLISVMATAKTQIEEKCARTLKFPFSATRGKAPEIQPPVKTKKKGIYEAPY